MESSAAPMRVCCAELLFESFVEFDTERILAAIRARVPNAQLMQEFADAEGSTDDEASPVTEESAGETAESEFISLAYPDYMVQYAEGEIPAQHVLAPPKPLDENDKARLERAMQQSWQWPDAGQTLARCTHSLLVMDLMASGLERAKRLQLFQDVLCALVELLPCRAIYRRNSEQLIAPQEFLRLQREVPGDFTLLGGAFNVRMFNIADGAADETVMDTLGLEIFGLTDFQCHFVGLQPDDVAHVLWNLVSYAWEQGDVIENGHTIQGITPDSKWLCHDEDSLVAPDRAVIDLDTGPPFNVGRWKRDTVG